MPYIKIVTHCVWSTKQRIPFLADKHIRYELFEHIMQNSKQKGIYIDYIGGEKDHVHCLISLGSEQTIAKIIQLIKGESSFWINRKYNMNLQWQDDYFAVSVSQSQLAAVRLYIQNQEAHHKKKTFSEEYNEFIEKYKFHQ